jgi:hypothetical protein
MSNFEDIFKQTVREHYTLNMMLARILTSKYVELGYVSEINAQPALESVLAQLEKLDETDGVANLLVISTLPITLDDDVLEPPYIGHLVASSIEISDEDVEREKELSIKTIKDSVDEITKKVIKALTNEWKNAFAGELSRIKNERIDFTSIIYESWGQALDSLDLIINLCTHLGDEFNAKDGNQSARQNDAKFDALIRIHARSCQVAGEIHSLLCSGFADGATARWRTLFELSVIAGFLSINDNETSKRYLLHSHIEEYKLMLAFQENAKQFGWSLIDRRTISAAKTRSDALISKYGKSYGTDYGWAAHILGIKNVRFSDIETLVALGNFESPFKMAHKFVHASSYGTMFPLSASPQNDFLVAGGSIFGLYEPGRQTAQAICSVTATLIASKPSIEHTIILGALIPLRNQVWKEFDDAEAKIRENRKRTRIRGIRIIKDAYRLF